MCRAEEQLGTPHPLTRVGIQSRAKQHVRVEHTRPRAAASLVPVLFGSHGVSARLARTAGASSHRCSGHGAGHWVTQGTRWLGLAPTRPRASGLLSAAACLLPCHPPRHLPLVLPAVVLATDPKQRTQHPCCGCQSSRVQLSGGRAAHVPGSPTGPA